MYLVWALTIRPELICMILYMLFISGGLYAIYNHKNSLGKPHFQSAHSIAGMAVIVGCVMSGVAGGVFLHPDFGVDKTNKTIRYVCKRVSLTVLCVRSHSHFFYFVQIALHTSGCLVSFS